MAAQVMEPRLTGWRYWVAALLGVDYVAVSDHTETIPKRVVWKVCIPHIWEDMRLRRLEPNGTVSYGRFRLWQPLTHRVAYYHNEFVSRLADETEEA